MDDQLDRALPPHEQSAEHDDAGDFPAAEVSAREASHEDEARRHFQTAPACQRNLEQS